MWHVKCACTQWHKMAAHKFLDLGLENFHEALGLLVELGLDEVEPDDVRQVADAAAYDVDDEMHRA